MMTPAIQYMYDVIGEKVNVYFETPEIKKMFLDWDKINILEKKPSNNPIIHSCTINQKKPDYEYQLDLLYRKFGKTDVKYHTYVDPIESKHKDCAVIIRGMVNDSTTRRQRCE